MEEDKNKRIAFSPDPEDYEALDELKRTKFYNKTYAEMYRYLIKLGVAVAKETD